MIINKKEIEKRLSDFCDVKKISNQLTEQERKKLFQISLEFAVDAYCPDGDKALGCNVAQSLVRNYLFALLTGNAVKTSTKNGIRKPVILEMGMGSGINAAAAAAINKDIKYIGVEVNPHCISFAKKQLSKYNISQKARIITSDYATFKLKEKADIIINENLGPNLVDEPQILAANKALQCTHKKTIFVPQSILIYGLINKKRCDYMKIDFSSKIKSNVNFTQKICKNATFQPCYEVIDFNGNIAVSQKKHDDFISRLAVIGEPIGIISKSPSVKISFYFSKRQIVIE